MSIKFPLVISKAYYKLFAYNFPRFVAVGGAGFIVNYIVLTLLYSILKLPVFISQLIGAETALLVTFSGNNFWAFHGHHHISLKKKIIKYHATSGMGIIISATIVTVLVKLAHFHYGMALVVAASVSLVWNYIFNYKVIFKKNQIQT